MTKKERANTGIDRFVTEVPANAAQAVVVYRAACEISKADGLPPKARQKAHFALYASAISMGAEFDDLDAATKCATVSYNVNGEPEVIDALATIQANADGPLGKAWAVASDRAETARVAWKTALTDYRVAEKAETLAYCKVIGKTKVSLDGKGKDGAALDVPFRLAVLDDGKVKASTGRGGGTGSGPAQPLADGKYQRTKGDERARMVVSKDGTVFTVTSPIDAKGSYTSATKAAVAVSPALGYASHSHNGRTFWKRAGA